MSDFVLNKRLTNNSSLFVTGQGEPATDREDNERATVESTGTGTVSPIASVESSTPLVN